MIERLLQNSVYVRSITSILIFGFVWLIRWLSCRIARRRLSDPKRLYHARRVINYTATAVAAVLIGRQWIEGLDRLATFFGLVSAGLAIAMHDTVANIAGWIFILWRKPFKVGDRIQIGDYSGDVIDTRLFEFSLIEIGNWVDAEQSSGRIVHVPNSHVLRTPLANYETGFEYIWHEMPILVTFESDWEKAKRILTDIVSNKTEHLSKVAEAQIRRAAMRYLIYFPTLTPIVYTSVRDSGVLLTIRCIVKPRERRGLDEAITEEMLRAFAEHDDIELAYPTQRFYRRGEGGGASPGDAGGSMS